MQVKDIIGDAGGYENLEPGDTATGITSTVRTKTIHGVTKDAIAALITCEDNTANFTLDGTTPTANAGTDLGHGIAAGESYMIRGHHNVRNFQCIDTVSGSASKIKVTVFF